MSSVEDAAVPESLRRLVRSILRGFYSVEQCIVVDMLVHTTIIREEELADRLHFDKRQLRQMLSGLMNDKLVRTRMRIETDSEKKTTRSNYYFIDYRLFVNVVKFKLDMMRRRLEADQRETTSRYSFRCPECQKTFTDMDVQHLFDKDTDTLHCTYCRAEVAEEEDKVSLADARALMVKYHEQVRDPIDAMLRECDTLRLSTELQEPEIRASTSNGVEPAPSALPNAPPGNFPGVWSGDLNKGMSFGASESTVTVSFAEDGDGENDSATRQARGDEQRPIWLRESTVDAGAGSTADSVTQVTLQMAPGRAPGLNFAPAEDGNATRDEIMATLLLHEKRTARPAAVGRARGAQHNRAAHRDASSSDGEDSESGVDSDDEAGRSRARQHDGMEAFANSDVEMDQDEEEEEEGEEYVVTFRGKIVPYSNVTQAMIMEMTPAEKEEYILVGKRWYADTFE